MKEADVPVVNSSKSPELVFLDTDAGHDDAMAMLLAGHSPHLKLLGISTVAGNQTVEKTTLNTLRMLTASNLCDIPVVRGAHKPLCRPTVVCEEIHGETGLDGTTFPPLNVHEIEGRKAIDVMFEIISKQPKRSVNMVTIGPLTNLANLVNIYPEVLPFLKRIVLMGGAIGAGNMGGVSEWNIQVDPEAAHAVFELGKTTDIPIVMIPLEVTHTTLVTPSILNQIDAFQSKFGKLLHELLTFFTSSYRDVFHFEDPPLHDPNTLAFLIDPSLYTLNHYNVEVETSSPLAAGCTIVDLFHLSKRPKNVYVAEKVNVDGFWSIMMDAFRRANHNNPFNHS